ncbi:hypothetical protein GOY17_03605 [Lysobacter soli]|uniref:hypothetical protein n=1 Tax=Lysobacter soli TaxID=453783 RepID=UPI0012EE4164|nr:hypothetical protein [Lysobacter soli]QGW64082.1 hypothetical protein GOY17_03605 [Lysobacter soli]
MGKGGALGWGLWFALAPLHAAGPALPLPVIWDSPACAHERIAAVEIDLGERPSEITRDDKVPTVDYGRAMRRLAEAAAAQGGNAVVLRQHQGVYFTLNGKRSRAPVYVKLRGAAIRLPDEASQCTLRPVDVADLEALSRNGKPQNVSSREAYGEK